VSRSSAVSQFASVCHWQSQWHTEDFSWENVSQSRESGLLAVGTLLGESLRPSRTDASASDRVQNNFPF